MNNTGNTPVVYEASIDGSPEISLLSAPYDGIDGTQTTKLEISAKCPDFETLLKGNLTLKTNETETTMRVIPIEVECAKSLQVKRIYKEPSIGSLYSLDFDIETNRLAIGTGGNERALKIIDIEKGSNIVKASDFDIRKLIWQKNTNHIVGVVSTDTCEFSLKTWDGISGEILGETSLSGLGCNSSYTFSSDGSKFAYRHSTTGWWYFIDLITGEENMSLSSTPIYENIAWNPDGTHAILNKDFTNLDIYLIGTQNPIHTFIIPPQFEPRQIHWMSDSKIVINSDFSSSDVIMIDANTGHNTMNIAKGGNYVRLLAHTPDTRKIAMAIDPNRDQTTTSIKIISGVSGKTLRTIPAPSNVGIWSMDWSRDGRYLAIGYGGADGGIVEIWEVSNDIK